MTAPIEGIVRNADGEIVSPPPGPLRDRWLKTEKAWSDYWTRGDSKQLVELGIFPEENQRES